MARAPARIIICSAGQAPSLWRPRSLNTKPQLRKEADVNSQSRTLCWTPLWNKNREGVGLEHLVLSERGADSVVLAYDEAYGPL
jgi:hypothetical protein